MWSYSKPGGSAKFTLRPQKHGESFVYLRDETLPLRLASSGFLSARSQRDRQESREPGRKLTDTKRLVLLTSGLELLILMEKFI